MKSTFFLFVLLFFHCSHFFGQTHLYGVMYKTYDYPKGLMYKFDLTTKEISIVKIFEDIEQGIEPYTLFLAKNNKIYGLTRRGGVHNRGVVFEYDFQTDIYTKKIDLKLEDAISAYESLEELDSGKIIGTSIYGGLYQQGTIFEYDYMNNTYETLYSFYSNNISGGKSFPYGKFIKGSDNKLYATLAYCYVQNENESELDLQNAIFTFDRESREVNVAIANNAALSTGSMALSDNNLYGVNQRLIFRYNYLLNSFDTIHVFENSLNSLRLQVLHNNTKLYGISTRDTINHLGIIYEYDLEQNTYTKKHDFDSLNGYAVNPVSLTTAIDGKLYGAVFRGGQNNNGGVFSYEINENSYTNEANFDWFVADTTHISSSTNHGILPQRFSGLLKVDENVNLGYDKILDDKIKLFPNPSSESFLIDVGFEDQNFAIKVADVTGKIILEQVDLNGRFHTFTLKQKGIYFISVDSNGTVLKTFRFVQL
jgi:uncharacterized repeat protein (TIGR03803 family)